MFWLLPGSIFTTGYLASKTWPGWYFSLFRVFLPLFPLFAVQLAVCTTSSHHNLRCSFNQEIQMVAMVHGTIVFVFAHKTATANKASNVMSNELWFLDAIASPSTYPCQIGDSYCIYQACKLVRDTF